MLSLIQTGQKCARPKFLLATFVLLLSFGNHLLKSQAAGDPIKVPESVEDAKNSATDFWQRLKNSLSFSDKDKDKPKLTVTEIVLVAVGAFILFIVLFCCIGYCLCECVKELICCVLCCKCFKG